MSILVDVGTLFSYTKNQRMVEVNGGTVSECLKHLAGQFPKLKLFDKDGNLHVHFVIGVNGVVVSSEELDQPDEEGDDLSIIFMIAGG